MNLSSASVAPAPAGWPHSDGIGLNTTPGISRVTASEACTDLTDFLMDYVPDCLTDGEPILREFHRGNIAATIAAGTYELQLNLIAQQALELPRGY